MPVASKEVIKAYFKANPTAKKSCNIPPAFLDLIQELFNRILATGSYIKLINKAIRSSIDPKLLLATALQASGLVDKEDKEDAEETKETKKTKETEEEIDEALS